MIGNFLRNLWAAGALPGDTPSAAYSVPCGFGTTMTQQDIVDGTLRVQIVMAMVHPAEFIVTTIQQQVQGGAS